MTNDKAAVASALWGTVIGLLVSAGSLLFSVLAVRFLPQTDAGLFVSFFAYANLVGIFLSGFQISLARGIALSDSAASRPQYLVGRSAFEILGLSVILGGGILGTVRIWNSAIGLSFPVLISMAILPLVMAMSSILAARFIARGSFIVSALISLAAVNINLLAQAIVFMFYAVSLEKVLVNFTAINLFFYAGVLLLFRGGFPAESVFTSISLRASATAFGYAFLVQFDLLLGGLFLSGPERDQYAIASMFAKSALFFAGTMYLALFTLVMRRVKSGQSFGLLELKSLAAAGLMGGSFSVLGAFFGPEVLTLVYGAGWAEAAELVPLLAIAVFPFFLAGVLFQSSLVRPSWAQVMFLALLNFLTLGTALLVVDSAEQLAFVSFGAGLTVFAFFAWSRYRTRLSKVPRGAGFWLSRRKKSL